MALARINGPMLQANLERQGTNIQIDLAAYFDVNNYRVGVNNTNPQYTLDITGNAHLGNLYILGNTITTVNNLTLANVTVSSGNVSNTTFSNVALGTPASGNLTNTTADGTNSVGFLTIPQDAQTGNYTLTLADTGKHIYHAANSSAATYTIPANSSVSFATGAAVTFINMSANNVSLAITSDTLYWSPSGGTGTRTLAQYGVATAVKITGTSWIVSGLGLT